MRPCRRRAGRDILRPQAWDLGITTAFFVFALVSFFRRSVALKYATLAMSVAYLGVTKSTLISVTDIFRFVHLDFPQFKYSLAWYLIAGVHGLSRPCCGDGSTADASARSAP